MPEVHQTRMWFWPKRFRRRRQINCSLPGSIPQEPFYANDPLSSKGDSKSKSRFTVTLERFSAYLGQLFVIGTATHEEKAIKCIQIVFDGLTVERSVQIAAGRQGSFKIVTPIPATQTDTRIALRFTFDDSTAIALDVAKVFNENDPVRHVRREFVRMLESISHGRVLEIGSRARSGHDYKYLVPPDLEYVGVDILPGPNVDVVGDAHKLSSLFVPDSFDAVYSIAVFEHLVMPWRVALEMNKVMKVGAFAWILTHQSFPLHDEPWDFWRYSQDTWRALFNQGTGFEVIEARMGEPVTIVGNIWNTITQDWDRAAAYMSSQVLIRKISATELTWNVEPESLLSAPYPG
jgi:hypothetical protein